MRVNILADKSRIVDYATFPIRKNISKFKELGYVINFYYSISDKLLECDILMLFSKPLLRLVNEKDPVVQESGNTIVLLKKARKYTNKIIWLDNSDSTTVTHFEILPYVDTYLKKQILKDRTLYEKNFVGGRIFTDFYHENYKIEDNDKFTQFYPLAESLSYKVKLSWNIGLGDMGRAFSFHNYLRKSLPLKVLTNYKADFQSCYNHKANDIFIKTSENLNRPSVAFHRQELIRQLTKLSKKKQFSNYIQGPKISSHKYSQLMRSSKIIPSPFGWGELGVRDYEAFINGALLLKPTMTHMDTWPNIFIPGETYQPFSWNFSDLDEKITFLLDNEKDRIRIAENGQEAYRETISRQGMDIFINYFIELIS
jgi:hypothetical protein